MQECSEYTGDDTKTHTIFYTVCQAFFYLFVVRHKQFVTSRNSKCKFIICMNITCLTGDTYEDMYYFASRYTVPSGA